MRIRVDPFILRQNSGSISGIGGNVNNAGQTASGIAQGAPNIDGQFGPQVQAIGNEALARAQGLFGRMNDLSRQLQSWAQSFESADIVGIAGFENVYNKAQILAPWLKLTGIPLGILNRYLMLGRFFGGTSFYGLLATLIMGNNLFSGNSQTSVSPITKPSTTFGDILKKTEEQEALKKERQPVKSPQPAPSPSQQPQISVGVKQNHENWAEDPMGPNGTMREYGCTVTALTMLLRYYGINKTPKDFNDWLRDHEGYVNGSNLDWSKAQQYLNSMLPNPGKLAPISGLDAINAELNAGRPVVLHVPGPTGDGHWVLAVPPPGKNGTFNAYDPWTGDQKSFSINQVKGDSRSFL